MFFPYSWLKRSIILSDKFTIINKRRWNLNKMAYYSILSEIVMVLVLIIFISGCEKRQINLYVADSISYGNQTDTKKCEKMCSEYPSSIQPFLDKGWRVVTFQPKEIVKDNFASRSEINPLHEWAGPLVLNYSYGCKCVGNEYILEKSYFLGYPLDWP